MPRGKINSFKYLSHILVITLIFSITARGQVFNDFVIVNDTPNEVLNNERAVICVDIKNIIHVVWIDSRIDGFKLYYSNSTDYGQSFSPNIQINNSQHIQYWSSIGADEWGRVHVAWTSDGNIYYSSLEVGAKVFNPTLKVNDDEGKDCTHTTMNIDGNGNVHIAWTDYRNSNESNDNSDIFYAKLKNEEISFTPNINIVEDFINSTQIGPIIEIDRNNNPHIIFMDNKVDNNKEEECYNIYHTKSIDGGSTFLHPSKVNDNLNKKVLRWCNSIFIDNKNNIHITFIDYRNDGEGVYYSKSENKGRTFSKDVMVSDHALIGGRLGFSTAVVDDNEIIHVIWADDRFTNNVFNIYYSNSTNDGASFNNRINISENFNLDSSQGSSMAIDAFGYLYIVWLGTKDDNTNVYFSTTISPVDSDRDGWIDCIDAFPDNPTQWQDEDGDGYGDNPSGWDPDIFPSDPTEWNDTDNDGVGDNSDYYPKDPSRFEREPKVDEVNWIMVLILIIIIIIVIIVTSIIVIKRRHSKRKQKPPDVF